MSSARATLVFSILVLMTISGLTVAQSRDVELSRTDQDGAFGRSTGPARGDDETCDDVQGDEGSDVPACVLARAEADLEARTLLLEGDFCPHPRVSMGAFGGTLERLPVFDSGDSFISADLTGHDESGTSVVLVECGCGVCAMDVALGGAGSAGPTGPTGPTGPEGPRGVPGPPGDDGASFNVERIYSRECLDQASCSCYFPEDRVLGGGARCAEPGTGSVDNALIESYPSGDAWHARCESPSPTAATPWSVRVVCLCGQDPCPEPPNQPPVAHIAVIPPSPADASIAPAQVNFISESFDPEGDPITCYEWTIVSTIGPTEVAVGPDLTTITRSYDVEQELIVRLRVTDDPGTSCDENTTFSPNIDLLEYLVCTNTPPTAAIEVVDETVELTVVSFTVSGASSFDAETPIRYEWDCDNGQFPVGPDEVTCVYERLTVTTFHQIELVVEDFSPEPGCVMRSEPARLTVVVPAFSEEQRGRGREEKEPEAGR